MAASGTPPSSQLWSVQAEQQTVSPSGVVVQHPSSSAESDIFWLSERTV
jgi:hypothetical protein